MSLSGYSVPETLTDDAGNALKSITVTVTGPSSYSGTATTDATTGVLRLGPLPVGDYTVTYRGRSVTVPVVAAAADVQSAYDLAVAAETPAGAQTKATAAQTAAIAAAAIDAASRVSTEATTRAGADSSEATARAAGDALAVQKASNLSDVASASTARTNLGLGNVSNTSDANKPVSTAQAAADAAVQAAAVQRANHTGTQLAATVSDFNAAAVAAGSGTYPQIVEHGGTAGTARPSGAVRVFWRGTVAPTNATQYDRWINTTTAPYTESIYNGTTWDLIGSASFTAKVDPGADYLSSSAQAALRPWFAALANRDNAKASAVFFGDSMVEGGNKTTASGRRWVDYLDRSLRSRFPCQTPVTGGGVYIPAFYQSYALNSGATIVPAAIVGGPLAAYGSGLGNRAYGMTTTGQSITFTFTGTGADLSLATHTTASAVAGVSIDGGTVTNVTLSSSQQTVTNYAIRSLTAGSHTVAVTWISTGPVVVNGLKPYNGDESKGTHVWEAGKGSTKASDYAAGDGTLNPTARYWQPLLQVQPQLISFGWGFNEYMQSIASTVYATKLAQSVSSALADITTPPTVLFVAFPQPNTGVYAEPWSNYVAVLKAQAAATANGVFLDFTSRMPIPTVNAAFTGNDFVHFNDAGQSYVADTLLTLLTPR